MKSINILILSLVFTGMLYAQRPLIPLSSFVCDTETDLTDVTHRLNKRKNLTHSNNQITFAVAHHVFLNDAGNPSSNPVKTSDIDLMMSNLNQEFSSFGISFRTVCIEFHNDTKYNNEIRNNSSTIIEVTSEYNVENALNIYYTVNPSYSGFASLPWKHHQIISLKSSKIHSNVVDHEFGHAFGMFHTHNKAGSFGGVCVTDELVNGSNCSTSGDYICDTPADPGNWYENDGNCNWNGDCRDANGQLYTPDGSNHMSYAPGECRSKFSNLQKHEMKKWANSIELESFIYQPTPTVELIGESYFCNINDEISIRVNGIKPSEILWSSSSNLLVELDGKYVTVRPSPKFNYSNTTGWISARFKHYCGSHIERKDFWITKPSLQLKSETGLCSRKIITYEALPKGPNYTWTVNGDVNYSIFGNKIAITGTSNESSEPEVFTLRAGIFQKDCFFVNTLTSTYSTNCSPTPCPKGDLNCIEKPIYGSVFIHNMSNELVSMTENTDPQDLIRELASGLYVLTIQDGSMLRKQLIRVK